MIENPRSTVRILEGDERIALEEARIKVNGNANVSNLTECAEDARKGITHWNAWRTQTGLTDTRLYCEYSAFYPQPPVPYLHSREG